MTDYLLDTQTFLWILHDDPSLSESARRIFLDHGNRFHLSIASYWETVIKFSIGKLRLRDGWQEEFESERKTNGVAWLDIRPYHIDLIPDLPLYHRDPFDRLIIAQAIYEKMPIITKDDTFRKYDVEVVW